MIGFAPIEEPVQSVKLRRGPPVVFKREGTECNYIVLFFIVGVVMLALGDVSKRA
jgi:hypothetical protein